MAALSSVPLQLGTRRRLGLLPLLLLATALALVAVTVLLHFKAPSSSSWTSTSLVSPAAYIAGLVRTGAAEISHPVNNEWEGGIGPTDSFNWQRGSDGDLVQLDNGTTITYRNPFGGTFDANPFSYEARAQHFSKPLSEPWDWETDRIRGVNLGGWLSLEPFITPSLFECYVDHVPEPARDEWTLSELVRADESLEPAVAGGADTNLGTERLERFLRREHYEQFITEHDFAEIAAAGLNWIRLPFPFWAIETWPGEPFLENVAWEYVLKAIEWARKYGLRINLDLHSLPGSQNGWNHSGKLGPIGFLQSAMGLANAQRTLDYLAALAEFCTRDGVRQVVGMLSVANEVPMLQVGQVAVKSFYAEAYERIRNVTGYGAGNGPVIVIHDGFKGTRRWAHFLETQTSFRVNVNVKGRPIANGGSTRNKHRVETKTRWIAGLDRVALDSHRYMAFLEPQGLSGIEDHLMKVRMKPCLKWAADFNRTFSTFGIPVSGEFSLAINDCGRFLNNVGEGNRLEGTFPNELHPQFPPSAPVGTCEFWERYDLWDEDMKSSLQDFARAQMDAFQNWFYWTWKTTPSSRHFPHLEANPLWSYSLGVRQGWLPRDPRDAEGFCFSHPRDGVAEPRRYSRRPTDPWKVGKAGMEEAGPIPPEVRERDRATWPPLELNPPNGGVDGVDGAGPETANLPVYERGRENATPLRGPVGSRKVHGRLDWVQPIEGCDYPDAWGGVQDFQGASRCTAAVRGVA